MMSRCPFVTGSKDARHKRSTHRLAAAAQASGMTTHLRVVAGEHNWQFATRAFRDILPALAGELDCPHHGTEPTRGVGTPDGGTPILDMVAHPTPAATAR